MVAPVASDAPSRLYRLFFPGENGAGSPVAALAPSRRCGPCAPAGPGEGADAPGAARLRPEDLDRFDASGFSLSYLHVRAEMSFERTAYDRTGQALSRESLSMSYERTELLIMRYGGANGAAPTGADAAEGPGGTEEHDPLQALRDYASPQNTANRILRFVEEGFHGGRFSGGTGAEARDAFRAFILPVIEGAAQDVLDAFGDALPEDVRDMVKRTLEMIRKGMGRFAEGGAAATEVVAGDEPEAHAA